MKLATLTVTVAPGCHVTVPHPSGIRELAGRVLSGGDTFSVDADTAADLFKARLILHPQTGAAPATPVYMPFEPRPYQPSGPRVTVGGLPSRSAPGMVQVDDAVDWRAYATQPTSSEDRAPTPPPHSCLGPVIDRTAFDGEPL